MNTNDLIRKAIKEVEYENKFEDMFWDQECPMPFFSKELRKENAKIKKYTVETRENGDWFEFLVKSAQKNKMIERYISTDNVSFKLYPEGDYNEILNFSYKGTNFPKLPENLNLSVSGEVMYIENEKYILRDNNSFGHVALFEKSKFGNKKYLFDFEYELSFESDELLEITKIDDSKDKKDITEYFNIILEMFNAVYRYIKEENSVNKFESYKRIIPKKISSL